MEFVVQTNGHTNINIKQTIKYSWNTDSKQIHELTQLKMTESLPEQINYSRRLLSQVQELERG